MKDIAKDIIEWNKICENNNFNYHLENSMLVEEFAELILALKTKNKREAVDAVIDILWVWIWTLHKLELKANEIWEAFEKIRNSNYSKFIIEDWKYVALRDTTGKIIKPAHYRAPDLSFIEN